MANWNENKRLLMDKQCAWILLDKSSVTNIVTGYIKIQTCDDGWDYTIYDPYYKEIDGGQLDNPEMKIIEARNTILKNCGLFRCVTTIGIDYDELVEMVEQVEGARFFLQSKDDDSQLLLETARSEIIYTPVSKLRIGDSINIQMRSYGFSWATICGIEDDKAFIVFDEPIVEWPMNSTDTNVGGYESSGLKKSIELFLFNLFPEDMKGRIHDLSIPSYAQIVGKVYERIPRMRYKRNRLVENYSGTYWLKDKVGGEDCQTSFYYINDSGDVGESEASLAHGVRLCFWLDTKEKGGD